MELPFAVEQSTTIHLNNGDSGGGTNNDGSRTTPSSSIRQQHSQQLEQSETDSLVTASSHGSLIDASCLMEDEEGENDDDDANNVFIDYNNDIHRHQHRQERHQRAAAVVGVCGDGVTNVSSSSPGGGPLPPNTPQDVVLPARRPSHQQQPQQRGQQHQEHVVVVTSSQDHQQPQQRHGHRHPHHQTLTEISSRGTVQVQDEGIHVVAVAAGGGGHSRRPLPPPPPPPPEADFTYVDVTSDDSGVDALLEGEVVVDLPLTGPSAKRPDILTVLLGGIHQYNQFDVLLQQIEHANHMAQRASDAKSDGDIVSAMEYHAKAAQSYRDNAYELRDKSPSLANTLLLLSQAQAKSAIAIKQIVKLNPQELRQVFPTTTTTAAASTSAAAPGRSHSGTGVGPCTMPDGGSKTTQAMSHKDRLRAAVRGALGSKHPHEADLSDSQFLGRAGSDASSASAGTKRNTSTRLVDYDESKNDHEGTSLATGTDSDANPVDEMMNLERELREMDMALKLGSSVSSLDARMHSRMKNSMIGDGSFMVVPPGSNSYMSSASMWGTSLNHVQSRPTGPPAVTNYGSAGVRARANRVQNMLEASSNLAHRSHISNAPLPNPSTTNKPTGGLESSWWGTASTASQILSSSVVSLSGGRMASGGDGGTFDGSSSANTKQIMRLMDSLKTLGDENAALMREVEELEAARAETRAAREEMKRFKDEYGKRFKTLKRALEKFRQENNGPGNGANRNDPVNSSDYIKSASVAEQLQRQEALIRKLTADLKMSKEESKKKDSALRKYESFYREVKARSAQKAAQRNQLQQQPPPTHPQSQQRRNVGTSSRR